MKICVSQSYTVDFVIVVGGARVEQFYLLAK